MTVTVRPVSRPRSLATRLYLPALRALLVTVRHFLANLVARRELVTIRYPEERPPYPARFRGLHRLMLRDDGSLRCVACMLCPTVCPAHCITVVAEDVGAPAEKRARLFEIDELRCISCGLCVEACPADAIRMDTGQHVPPTRRRADAVWDAPRLAALGGRSSAPQEGAHAPARGG